jgi:hypothetical protein
MALRGQGMVQMGTVRFHIGSADCTGCECSVVQQLLAWATMGHNSAIRQRCRQKNVGTPWESGGGHRRESRVLFAHVVLVSSSRREPCAPTTARGWSNGQNSQPMHVG